MVPKQASLPERKEDIFLRRERAFEQWWSIRGNIESTPSSETLELCEKRSIVRRLVQAR